MARFIKINPSDNVAVALSDASAGEECIVDGIPVTVTENIPAGHKVALSDLSAGDDVIKYGFPVGHLVREVRKGGLIDHTTLKTNLEGILDYKYTPGPCDLKQVPVQRHPRRTTQPLPGRQLRGHRHPL